MLLFALEITLDGNCSAPISDLILWRRSRILNFQVGWTYSAPRGPRRKQTKEQRKEKWSGKCESCCRRAERAQLEMFRRRKRRNVVSTAVGNHSMGDCVRLATPTTAGVEQRQDGWRPGETSANSLEKCFPNRDNWVWYRPTGSRHSTPLPITTFGICRHRI